MTIKLEKLNPKFRQLIDLLFFSEKINIDISNFKVLYKENSIINFEYLCDVFERAIDIFWENNDAVWQNRFNFLFSLNEKAVSKFIESCLEKRMHCLIRADYKKEFNILSSIEFIQYLAYCKVKSTKRESLSSIKNFLAMMPDYYSLNKFIEIINRFIPFIFENMNEFSQLMMKKILDSPRKFDLLIALENQGFTFDKTKVAKLAKDILIKRKLCDKNIRVFFKLINDPVILSFLKKEYVPAFKIKLIKMLKYSTYLMIEEFYLRNIKNIIDLDPTIADELAIIYADKLYQRAYVHKKSNADRLIKLLKLFPQISAKKMLVYLSGKHKMSDIKYVLQAFPKLSNLAAFV